MSNGSKALRTLLAGDKLIFMPSAYDGIGARMIKAAGFQAVYNGGYVTGGSKAISEPLVTMTEQVQVAGDIASAVDLPVIADAGAGFGEPLHTMRTVREFARAGVAGIHIEDQLYPKRAHYHKYMGHSISRKEFADKIDYACRERDRVDPDFVIIARSDVTRDDGLEEACARVNLGAEAGADVGMLFAATMEDARRAVKLCKIPLVYTLSRGNRDNRPLPNARDMQEMGYKICLDAVTGLVAAAHAMRIWLEQLKSTGEYTALTHDQCRETRDYLEEVMGLDDYYEVEAKTVEG